MSVARLREGHIEVIAPHGLDDRFGMLARPVFAYDQRPKVRVLELKEFA